MTETRTARLLVSPWTQLEQTKTRLEAVREYLQSDRRTKRYLNVHADRMEALTGEAGRYIDQAESLLNRETPYFNDGVTAIAFHASLKLAQKNMLLAVLDPVILIGERHSEKQSKRAKLANEQRTADRKPVNRIIDSMAFMRHMSGELMEPREIWPHLYAQLDGAGLNPDEVGAGVDKLYKYDGGEIRYSAFRKQIERARK